MPTSDVSDLRDVVDAINRLCDTMKTSHYEEHDEESYDTESFVSSSEGTVPFEDTDSARSVPLVPSRIGVSRDFSYESTRDDTSLFSELENASLCQDRIVPQRSELQENASPNDTVPHPSETYTYEVCQERLSETFIYAETFTPESSFRTIEMNLALNYSDSLVSLPVETVTSDVACEPVSEMYYTASSEVSLLSDTEVLVADRVAIDEDPLDGKELTDDRKDCVIAGHVAAMRERFESMTRTNTPCPDLMRSSSPSLDIFRNITPSPDRLG